MPRCAAMCVAPRRAYPQAGASDGRGNTVLAEGEVRNDVHRVVLPIDALDNATIIRELFELGLRQGGDYPLMYITAPGASRAALHFAALDGTGEWAMNSACATACKNAVGQLIPR